MKNGNCRDYKNIFLLIISYFFIFFILTRGVYLYGSRTDWQNQSWEFAEYFRNLFYETHQWFPNFAFHIGSGENIYYFSYYGLFSPLIMISYLFPFMKMMDYIITVNILTVISSIILFYVWLRTKKYDETLSVTVSFLFLFASPLIYQSHRQMMFISYFPFFCMALMGIDLYFEKKKSTLFTVSLFLMIMTSYYFSVTGIVVLVLYAIYRQLSLEDKFDIKKIGKCIFSICVRIAISVSMSAVLILPTLFALKNGRSASTSKNMFAFSWYIPKISLENILYSSYATGVTSIAMIAIMIGILSRKKERKFLAASILLFISIPFFNFILNGTLYTNSKIFIPFLPLVLLLVAELLSDAKEKKIESKVFWITVIVMLIIFFWNIKWEFDLLYLVEGTVTLFLLYRVIHFDHLNLFYAFIVGISVCICLVCNLSDVLVKDSSEDTNFSSNNESLIQATMNQDNRLYRITNDYFSIMNINKIYGANYYQTTVYSSAINKTYSDLFYHVFGNNMIFRNARILNPTDNILFNTYMGNKYLITSQNPPIGYTKINADKKIAVYENKNVFPIGYATGHVISNKVYKKLTYPYNVEALLNYAVVNTSSNQKVISSIDKSSVSDMVGSVTYKNLTLNEQKKVYSIQAMDQAQMKVRLKQDETNKILMIRFHMDLQDKTKDLGVTINGVANKLTCSTWQYQNNNREFNYVLSSNQPINQLDIQFLKGNYQISKIEIYMLDYNSISNNHTKIDPFMIDKTKTKGDVIDGNVNVKKDGYFVLNVPYDKGFQVKVNGKDAAYEKVNTSFLGFKLQKGEQHIHIIFQAPYAKEGKIISLIGLILWIGLILLEKGKHIVQT